MGRKRSSGSAGATLAVRAAEAAGIDHEVIEYAHEAGEEGYGEEAARVLGQPPEQMFKTLVADAEGVGLAVAVIPVAGRLDLKALAAAVGAKRATMADPRAAERATGYVVGGISPLGQRRRLPTVVDATAETFDRIYVSAGRRGLEIALAPGDLIRLCAAVLAPVTR